MRRLSAARGTILAFLCASLLWIGLPGGGEFWPLLPLALVPLLVLAGADSLRKRLLLGLLTGFVHFLLQIYWIVIVLGRYGHLPWYFSYPALVLLSFYMACYVALFVLLTGSVMRRWGRTWALWLSPCLWVGLDWLRSVLFSGFPWMDLGYGLWQESLLIQIADLFGHHILTFGLVLCSSLAVFLFQEKAMGKRFIHCTAVLALLGGVLGYGHLRMLRLDQEFARVGGAAVVGVVQGNIDQSMKWSPEEQQRTVSVYLRQTEELMRRSVKPELVVWPETALPFYPMNSRLTGALRMLAMEEKVTLLTGSPWYEVVSEERREVDYFNSAFLITPTGEIRDRYYKSHLVPFGEYVPMRTLLPFLAPLVETVGDFTPGKVSRPLTAGSVKAGVLICFESIFPDIARKWVAVGANLLVNLTNDAWYGRSSAPSQSWAMSVLRAVETRRSLVRAANTGISGFVDPLGRVRKSSDIFVTWSGASDVDLYQGLSFYTRYGYLFGPLCGLLVSLVAGALLVGRSKPPAESR